MASIGSAATTSAEAVRRGISGRRMDVAGRLFEGVLLLSLLISLAVLVTLLADVTGRGMGVFVERGLGFVTAPLSSDPGRAGIGQGVFGSLMLMLIVAVVAFPVGIGAAIYLEEYARDTRATRFFTANIRNLAGVPSIVYGLLGLAVFVIALRSLTGPQVVGRSILSGGLTLAIVVLPIVIITASEALRAVPRGIREAAFGVGATRWQVVRSHVVPYAAPGILTGTILAMARAFGETAPLIMVGGAVSFLSTGDRGVLETLQGKYTTLPTSIYQWVQEPRREFVELTAAGIIALLVTILLVNGLAIILRNRFARRW
ncbi:MAG TPA: phosphate ABC transporter permease PstA [Candidatus Limnocylindria bacterium]|nr:phosphate ABC transporter permease PstA [Candidatus Limnocylindria bacterium]